ncbi:MAG TPA: hypothetical protein VLT45_21095, partial [Kofleriaceae bacterium]|nr:hypothetical protein [Kofleriaceae bacterium]
RGEPAPAPSPAEEPHVPPGELAPLICSGCGAPLAITDADEAVCACGKTTSLPEPYRQLRDANRMSERDAAELHALAKDIAKPAPAWKRVAMIVGYVVGGATVVVMAIGAIVGTVVGLVAGSWLGESVAKLFAAVGAIAFGLVSIPYVGEWLAAFLTLHDAGAASDVISGPTVVYRYDLIAAAILYVLGALPLVLALRTHGNLRQLDALQNALAAQRSTAHGGALCCRQCGAALDVSRDAIVTRCLYCGTDNLLTVSTSIATAHAEGAKALDAKVQDVIAQHARDNSDERAGRLAIIVLGLLLAPFACIAGYALHRVVLS